MCHSHIQLLKILDFYHYFSYCHQSTIETEKHRHSLTVCAKALALLCFTKISQPIIAGLTGISERWLRDLKKTAFKHRFDPEIDSQIYKYYIEDGKHSRHLKEITPE